MSSMAVAAAQKVAAPSFSPYASTPSMAARISLSADSSVGSHVVTGNSSHRQGQQPSLSTSFRGVPLPPSLTPPPQNPSRGMARNGVQLAEPQFVQSEYAQAMAANALLQQRLEAERQGYGADPRASFGPELEDHGQFFPPSSFVDSLASHSEFGRDIRTPAPVHSRSYAPFPGAYRNDAVFRGDAVYRDERLAEDYSRLMYRREQEFERPSTSFDRSPSGYSHRSFSIFPAEDKPSPDAFVSLANRLNNAALNHNRSANLDLNHRPFTAAEHPRSYNSRIDTQPFNAAIAGIVESLEKSLAISPPGERTHEWGFSPRGQETPRYRFEEEMRGRNGRGFEGFRELDDVLPNGRQVDPTRVMVSGISWQMSAHQIRDELVHRCSKLGKVVDIEVAQYRGNSPSQLDRGRHRGFAFVTMETPEQATLVMAALHKVDMGGMQVQTKPGVVKDPMFARRNYAKKKAEEVVHKPLGRKHVKVFVGNLWFGTDAERLREAFHEFGLIVDTKVVRDKDSGESRGFGFVTFANESAAIEAISARDGAILDGRKLVVNVSRSWAGSSGEEESSSEGACSEFSHERH